MKVLLSWLREFAPEIDGEIDELGETLSALGLAVEQTEILGEGIDEIVVAEVLDLRPHPDADRIQLVDVDAGDGEALQVCCGAFNMSVGDLIPFAPVGTTMPSGLEIARRKMRGEWSNGMCCSVAELGLGEDHEGIMIFGDLPDHAGPGTPVVEALGLERDVLWDLEVNANRPDAMSVAGVARDLAAGLGVPFEHPDWQVAESGEPASSRARIEIVDPDLCGRFVARVIDGVTIGESPAWMQRRLLALGMRPISSIVDISNYVMLELGQPNHAYDLDLLPDGALRIRRAHDGESLVTLDGIERNFVGADGLIANGDDQAIGIAGIMGGRSTEISESTTSVLLELAWWDPPSINRTVKRLQLRSEASARFARGADWGDNLERAAIRFAQLAADAGATLAPGVIDERGTLPDTEPIIVRSAKVSGLVGAELTTDEMAAHLESIGFATTRLGDDLSVTVPSWRWDSAIETDLVEEIARLHGYEHITRTIPKGEDAGALTPYQLDRRLVRQVFVGLGCDEAQPLPFLAPGDLERAGLLEDGVRVSNPLVADESILRTSLLPGLLKAIAYNQSHRSTDIALFEIGHVFLPPVEGDLLPDEREMLGVAFADEAAPLAVRALDVLGEALSLPNLQLADTDAAALHPTRRSDVVIVGRSRGLVGEIDPTVLEAYGVDGRVAWLELDLGAVLEGPHGKRTYRRVSKYPSSDVDLAFVVGDDVQAARVEAMLRKGGGSLLAQLTLFDVYRGEAVAAGARSLAFRLRFRAEDRTLTDAEVADVRQSCIDAVTAATGATLRS